MADLMQLKRILGARNLRGRRRYDVGLPPSYGSRCRSPGIIGLMTRFGMQVSLATPRATAHPEV